MSEPWHSLYTPAGESQAAADTLRALLESAGYHAYDPFPGGTGTPLNLTEMVRQFVAPVQAGWICVLGQPDESLLPDLSRELDRPILAGWLTDDSGGFAVYQAGIRADDPAAFAAYLRPGSTPDQLQQAFAGKLAVDPVASDQPPVAVLGADALPPEIQQLAQEKGVNPKQANKLFERLSGNLFGKLQSGSESSQEQEQARAVLMGGGRDLWNSLDGQRVRAIASVLALPPHWRTPDWQTVRDAYHVHRLRQRSPRMPLMPGDREALDAVPNALEYLPVYMGR